MSAKEKKGLGTGLAALFGEEEIDEQSELVTVPITKVEPRKDQPRQNFDEDALRELADSISQYGLIQPIVARKLPNGFYQIIAGERRWRASRMAGLAEVPVRVIEADDRTTAELALVENLQRENLNPIEEAKGYKTLIEEYGLTQEEAAKSVGKSRPAITNSMRLLSLSGEVLKLVEDGKLSAGHARALIPITDEKAQLDAAKEVITKSLSVRKTETLAAKIAKDKGKEQKPQEKEKPLVDYSAEVEKELGEILGRKVKLVSGKTNGRIEIEFYGADDRESLIDRLRKLK
jgi:ParB family transcriptional regulator, chromosome partitioning protein